MVRKFLIGAASVAVLALSATALAQQSGLQFGTADEARVMLTKALPP